MVFFRNVYAGRTFKSATLGINQLEMGLWLISAGAKMACVESTAIEKRFKRLTLQVLSCLFFWLKEKRSQGVLFFFFIYFCVQDCFLKTTRQENTLLLPSFGKSGGRLLPVCALLYPPPQKKASTLHGQTFEGVNGLLIEFNLDACQAQISNVWGSSLGN